MRNTAPILKISNIEAIKRSINIIINWALENPFKGYKTVSNVVIIKSNSTFI